MPIHCGRRSHICCDDRLQARDTATGARELTARSVTAREREYHQISHDVREWIMRELATLGGPVPVTELLQPSFPGLTEAKIDKAMVYATQSNRVTLLEVTFQSDSATRHGRWNRAPGGIVHVITEQATRPVVISRRCS